MRCTIGQLRPLQPRYVKIPVERAWEAMSNRWVKSDCCLACCQQVLTHYPQWTMGNLHRISTLSTVVVENGGCLRPNAVFSHTEATDG
jgi:hypothetical protein